MKQLIYYLLFGGWYLFSLLPLRVLYILSDGLYYLITYLIRYRRKVIYHNLQTSFPTLTASETDRIAKDFYAHFCDYIVETLKLLSMPLSELKERMKFEGIDELEQEVSSGRSVVLFLGHYGNWEWISSLALHTSAQCGQIYHPLENPYFDRLFLKLRGRSGGTSIAMEDTFQCMYQWKKQGICHIVGFIADQSPLYSSIHHFTDFLHHDTPVLTGGERIARVLDCSIFYVDIHRIRRGYYRSNLRKLTSTPKEEPLFAPTDAYFKALEQTIHRAPAYWLWSHNRWKRTREGFNATFTEAERAKRLSRL